jgi:Zn-dependent metalloprotease
MNDPRCSMHCILPPRLLHEVAANGSEEVRKTALETLALDARFRLARAEAAARSGGRAARPVTFARVGGKAQRTIYNQNHEEAQTPGTVARSEGQAPVSDEAVNQAYDGLGATYDYYWNGYKRDSIDGQGLPLLGLVHYGKNYDNAFWDNAGHMFFGDGDGKMLTQTTAGIDVIGHELTHGVTQNEANLVYSGQSGALNESISDVFGIQIKQQVLKQDATESNWLIGEDIVGPELSPALRSMKEPGKANPYDDQPAKMAGYVPNGDVHTNSGIPNHAFYLIATILGGHSWEVAGPVWYAALCDPSLPSTATFAEFGKRTLIQAERTYGQGSKQAQAISEGWEGVEVPL